MGEALATGITATRTPTAFQADFLASVYPSGVTFNTITGQFSGVPTTPGSYSFLARARNASGWSLPKFTTLAILPAATAQASPVVFSGNQASEDAPPIPYSPPQGNGPVELVGHVGERLEHQTWVAGGADFFIARDLPEGLVLNAFTGEVSGVPVRPGHFNAYVRPFQDVVIGEEVELRFQIEAAAGTPVMAPDIVLNAVAGKEINGTLNAMNSPSAFNLTEVPDFLFFDALTGAVAGTPHVPGTYRFKASAVNTSGEGMPVEVTVQVSPAAGTPVVEVLGTIPVARVGELFTMQLTSTPTADFYDGGAMPFGLSLNADTGVISGKPLVVGAVELELWGVNEAGQGRSLVIPLEIAANQEVPVITTPETVRILGTEPSALQLAASPSADHFTLSPIPPGFTFDPSSGLLSGPATTGSWTFEVGAVNEEGSATPKTIRLVAYASPAELWQGEYFEDLDPALAAWDASASGDSITNLMKYALGMNPSMPGTAGLPTVSLTKHDGQSYLTLVIDKNPAATDVTYIPQIASTLAPDAWHSGPGHLVVVEESPERLIVRDSQPMSNSARRFMRLLVEMVE